MGYADPDQMLEDMPAETLEHWKAFFVFRDREQKKAREEAEQEAKAASLARGARRR